MRYKIAIVEDDKLISHMIKLNLEKKGYLAQCFIQAESLLEQIEKELFDLIILDILLPGISGIKLLKELRKRYNYLPVLIVTVKNDIQNKINVLNLGADDYLVKPFNIDELLARVKALIRRSHGRRIIPSSRILIINGFRVNLSNRICETNKGQVVLSKKEIDFLLFLSLHARETLSRADILEEVWGMDVYPTPRTIDNFIRKFRKLFEDNPKKPKHFLTVRNQGYRFEN